MTNKFDLTKEAQSIFGEIVECAYCLNPKWSDKISLPDLDDNSIEPKDAYPVFVKFTNGRSFELWSSEWGGVSSITEKQYIQNAGR